MKKSYKLSGLDCAHCAEKIEAKIKKIDGVKDASINFMLEKLILEADDEQIDDILPKAQKAASKVLPDCRIIL